MLNNVVCHCDNLDLLKSLPDNSIALALTDPPYSSQKIQKHTSIKTVRDDAGDRVGFQGKKYRTIKLGAQSYSDIFDDFLSYMEPRLIEVRRVLASNGSLYIFSDYREVHYLKVLLDQIFGRESFINDIVWSYDMGYKQLTKWPTKHDNILWYAKDPDNYIYNVEDIDRIPYMAPGLVGPEKAARGKLPTDSWWNTICCGHERTGYPTQKPLKIIKRIVTASSNAQDLVLDPFSGSGTTGAACLELGRRFILADKNPEAIATMRSRFAGSPDISWIDNGADGKYPDYFGVFPSGNADAE